MSRGEERRGTARRGERRGEERRRGGGGEENSGQDRTRRYNTGQDNNQTAPYVLPAHVKQARCLSVNIT
eukprot:1829053-Lingulodinium_polyedra.AAC.1